MKGIHYTLLLFLSCAVAATSASAQCTCVPQLTIAQEYHRSDEVFVGRVIDARKNQNGADSYDVIIRFQVIQTWKNDLERYVTAKEFQGSTEGFVANSEWLVYAVRDTDEIFKMVRGCCSRTKLLTVAKEQGNFVAFRRMKFRPKEILDSN